MPERVGAGSGSVAGLILAGGHSSRMGRDKALIEMDGIPLIRRIYGVAQDCTPEVYVITPWPDRYRAVLPPACQFLQEETDSRIPQGPLGGFAQGLSHLQTAWVLLLACDLPRLQSAVLHRWMEMLPTTDSATMALLTRHPKGWDPLCGFYRRSCLQDLKPFMQEGGRSFQAWLTRLPVQELPLSDRSMLLNCNTPADLEALS